MKITAKLGDMYRPAKFDVLPPHKDGRITIQSATRIAVFKQDGHGLLSKEQPDGAAPLHLSPLCGSTHIEIPSDVLDATLKALEIEVDPNAIQILMLNGGEK